MSVSALKRGSFAAGRESGSCLHIGGVRRARRHDVRRLVFAAPGGGVAEGAVIRHARSRPSSSQSRPASPGLPPRRRRTIDSRPGPGSRSGKTRGSTSQMQYGMPRSPSAPSEPYLNCSASFAKTCGSSRKNFTQPKKPPAHEQATNVPAGRASTHRIRFPFGREFQCHGVKTSSGTRRARLSRRR